MASRLKTEPSEEQLEPVTYVGGVPILSQGEPPIRAIEWFGNVPLLYEDDDEGDMGESNPHLQSNVILYVCLSTHFAHLPQYQVFSDLNLYYRPEDLPEEKRTPYATPDTMVVEPYRRLDQDVSSYTVDEDGPAPLLTIEILSRRSAQQRDLKEKIPLYAYLGVQEYILVDITGNFLPQKLLLKRLQEDGTYKDERDADGGVTSKFGFRIIIDADGQVRVINTATGYRYIRPLEAEAEARKLQEEVARLRELLEERNGSAGA